MNKYENSRQPPYLHHIVLAAKTPTPQPRHPLRRRKNPRPLAQIPKISVPQPLGLPLRVNTVILLDIISNILQFLAGSFLAVSKRNFARKYAFDSNV